VTARREAEAAERTQRLMAELLEETAVLLTSSLQFDEVAEAILNNVARVIPHRSTALFLLNETDMLFRIYTIQEEDGRTVHSRPLALSLSQVPILQQMAQSGEPRLINDVQRRSLWIDHPESPWVRSFAGAPLQTREKTLGFLALLSDEEAHFRPEHLDLLQAFATQATIAIQNAHCHAEEIERRESLEALQQAGLCLITSLELSQVLDKILQAIFDLVEAKNAYIFLLENGRLVFEAGLTESGPVSQPFAPPRPEGITYTALRRGEPVVVQDSRTAPVFAGAPADWGRFSMVSLPIQFKGETFGVVNVAGSVERPFTPLTRRTLDTLAAYAAVAIQNARLHAQVRRHAAELEQRVTERTAELRQERNRLQAILDNVGDGIFFADKKGRIRFANPALEAITGYPADALMGRQANVWRGTTSPAVIADLEGALAAESSWNGEVINRRWDGTLYDAYVTITPLFNEAGAFRGYVGSQRDITHLKELNRLKDQFVSRIGHELITPITTLLLYLDLITYNKNKDHTAYLKTMQREAERLNKLVRGFLRLADLNTDASQVNLASHGVVALLREALPAWQAQAERRNLTLDTNFTTNSATALADADLLLEAVELLLDNSFNYTPDYGCVVLAVSRCRQKRPWVTITVTDTGPGVAPGETAHIFDRFYRGKVTEEYDVPGAGLGLAICQEIMENLEGRITVDGNFGHGASFTLWLKPAPTPDA
jgi:PAS domain S-box-containing protein